MKRFHLEPEFMPPPPPLPEGDEDDGPPPPPPGSIDEDDFRSIPPPPPVEPMNIPAPPPRKRREPGAKTLARNTPVIMSTKSKRIPESEDVDLAPKNRAGLKPQNKPKLELWGGIKNIEDSTLFRNQKNKNQDENQPPIASQKPPAKQIGKVDVKSDQLAGLLGTLKVEAKAAPVFTRGNSMREENPKAKSIKPQQKPHLEIDILEGNFPVMKLKAPVEEEQVKQRVPVKPKVSESKPKAPEIPKKNPQISALLEVEDDGQTLPTDWKKEEPRSMTKSPTERGFQMSAKFSSSEFDGEVFSWVNKVRKNPLCLVPFLQERLAKFEAGTKNLIVSDRERLVTHEGTYAVQEAINFLDHQDPVQDLKWNDMLAKACEDHVREIGSEGLYTHKMKDGSQPTEKVLAELGDEISAAAESLKFNSKNARDIIIEFVVDDGVASRGNRKNLFGDWDMMACFTGDHKVSGSMTTTLFAQSASMSQGILQKLVDEVNATMTDPEGWRQKQQKIMFTGDEITLTNVYNMLDGSEKVIEVTKRVKNGRIVN